MDELQASTEFQRVVHIYDRTSGQVFFVNTTLLRKSCEGVYIPREGEAEEDMGLTSDNWIDCVSLEVPPVLVSTGASRSVVQTGLTFRFGDDTTT